jgi:hypothetical protein
VADIHDGDTAAEIDIFIAFDVGEQGTFGMGDITVGAADVAFGDNGVATFVSCCCFVWRAYSSSRFLIKKYELFSRPLIAELRFANLRQLTACYQAIGRRPPLQVSGDHFKKGVFPVAVIDHGGAISLARMANLIFSGNPQPLAEAAAVFSACRAGGQGEPCDSGWSQTCGCARK